MAARRGMRALTSILVVLVLLGVAVVVADVALRSYAEGQIKTQLTGALPNSVTADPDVSIGGFSFISQYLAGSFDTVTIDAPGLSVDGTGLDVHVVATGVPIDQSTPVRMLTGTISLDQDALDDIVRIGTRNGSLDLGDATLRLGDGDLRYDGHTSFLGFGIDYTAIAKPVAKGKTIDLVPTAVDVSSGAVAIDVKSLLGELATRPIPVCVAQYLPRGVLVTGVEVHPDRATITLEARDVVLNALDFDAHGSCDQ